MEHCYNNIDDCNYTLVEGPLLAYYTHNEGNVSACCYIVWLHLAHKVLHSTLSLLNKFVNFSVQFMALSTIQHLSSWFAYHMTCSSRCLPTYYIRMGVWAF